MEEKVEKKWGTWWKHVGKSGELRSFWVTHWKQREGKIWFHHGESEKHRKHGRPWHPWYFQKCNMFSYEYLTKVTENKSSKEWTWDVQICVKTFTTDRGPPTLAMSMASSNRFCPPLICSPWQTPPSLEESKNCLVVRLSHLLSRI